MRERPKRKVFILPIIAIDDSTNDFKAWYRTKCAVVAENKIEAAFSIIQHPDYDKKFKVLQPSFQETNLRKFRYENSRGIIIGLI